MAKMNLIFNDFIGISFIISSIFDCWKYIWQSSAIKRVGTAKGHSRKFLNAAMFNDMVKLCYGLVIMDIFIIASSILALVTMGYNFYTVYKFYPYRMRGCTNFK